MADPPKLIQIIRRPGNRAGLEIWVGPLGLIATWPPSLPIDWSWGWWRHEPAKRPRSR
jgi:hypothetical protein